MTQQQQIIPLRGGLDLVSPALMIEPGRAISALNYEVEARGYRRMAGYERFDGHPKPSDAVYYAFQYAIGTIAIVEGDVITGVTSGATGIVVRDAEVFTGSYGASTAAGVVYMHAITGTFNASEVITIAGTPVAELTSSASRNGAPDTDTDTELTANVAAKRRAAILPPAGQGPVRGVATYGNDTYCWRDAVGGASAVMFKATASGWQAQAFGTSILFDAATAEFKVGETLTGVTSGATGTIKRVVLASGAYDGAGTGVLVLSGGTGTFADNETVTSASGSAKANGASAAVTLPPGGQYRHIEQNFYGTVGGNNLYFVNGVGRAHEWDGVTLTPIYTGLTDAQDKPQHIATHRNHLFLGYATGSVQHSAIDDPVSFDVARGAGEIGFGQVITGMVSNTRDSLIITAQNKLGYLTGASSADFTLQSLSEDSGAIADTLQVVGSPIFLDDQGVRDMAASQAYGDWKIGTKTQMVEPLLRTKRDALILASGSLRVRAKDQYRLFFNDGSGLFIYFGRKNPEVMTFQLPIIPYALTSGEDSRGYEVLLAAGSDGYVYEMDRGVSFDGESIQAFLRLSFMNQGGPNTIKRYHRCRLEGQAAAKTALKIVSDCSYGSPELTGGRETDFVIRAGGGFWNEANWNEFVWSAQIEGQAFADLNSIGENVSVAFISDADDEEPHTLSALTLFYSMRRRLR